MTETEIIGRLADLTEKLSHFPGYKEIQAHDNKLRVAIMKDGRGLGYFAKLLGHQSREWWTAEKVEHALREVVARIGHFPTQRELEELGMDHLCQATYKYGNGLVSYRNIICPDESNEHKYEVIHVPEVELKAVDQDDLGGVLIGSMLGDGSLTRTKGAKSNSSFTLSQAERRKEYVEFINLLTGGSVYQYKRRAPVRLADGTIINDEPTLAKLDKPFLIRYCTHSYCHQRYTEMRKKWYPQGVKVVPHDLVLNPLILAHWFVQDGHNHQTRTSITLHTNAFTVPDVEFLIGRLESDLGIADANVQFRKGKPIIFIGKKDYFKFIETVKPHIIWKCFEYKVDTSKVKRARKNYGRYKLTMDDARVIRKLYFSDNYTQSELAKMFGVTQTMIGRVVNNKAHVDHAVGFGGECEVKVNYNV